MGLGSHRLKVGVITALKNIEYPHWHTKCLE